MQSVTFVIQDGLGLDSHQHHARLYIHKIAIPHYFDYYGNMEMNDAVLALSALAQHSRLIVFRLLVQAGPTGLAAGKISAIAEIPPSSLSFHLKEMTHAGLIQARQEGRFLFYSANFNMMNNLIQYLTDNCCGGEPCLDASLSACLCETPT